MTEDLKQKGAELVRHRSALDSTKLDNGQKIVMTGQLTRDRDNERNVVRQQREAADRIAREAREWREKVEFVQREVEQKHEQMNQIVSQIEEVRRGPLKGLGLF